jgi:hypothetical protein
VQAQFLSKLIFEDDGGLPFILVRPLVYLSNVTAKPGKINKITVPAGFKTDLASIPRIFWRVLPPVGKYDAAAVVHDYLYQNNGVTRLTADDVLNEAMGVLGVPAWQRTIIYAGVRVGGWKPWNDYRAKDRK